MVILLSVVILIYSKRYRTWMTSVAVRFRVTTILIPDISYEAYSEISTGKIFYRSCNSIIQFVFAHTYVYTVTQ